MTEREGREQSVGRRKEGRGDVSEGIGRRKGGGSL